jgi:hypothetical protein
MTKPSEPIATSGQTENEHSEEVNVVLAHPDLKELADQSSTHGERLRVCVEGIVRERPADLNTRVEAARKAFRAITDKLSVFISYKRTQHAQAATKLKDTLDAFGNEKVDVFLDTQSLAYGEDWYHKIGERLKEANCFILLVPDVTDEREWPIFETGYFAGQMLPGERLVCLHHPNVAVPKQIQMYHATTATKKDVQKLLQDILVLPNFIPGLEAINAKSKNRLADDARPCAPAFGLY